MEKLHKAGQIYGYIVCLVVVITFLISIAALIGAMFDLSDPLHVTQHGRQPTNLASFETYKIAKLESLQEGQLLPDDQTLRVAYESEKTNLIQSVRFQARRSLTINGLLIIICITLFTTHWLWLRRLARVEA